MPKAVSKKLFTCKRKEVDGSRDHMVIKFRGLNRDEIRKLRNDLNEFIKHWLEPEEEKSEY